jgi:hypothetical protein
LRLVDVLVVFEPVDLVVVLSGGHRKSQQEVAVRDWFASSFRAQDNVERVFAVLRPTRSLNQNFLHLG